MDIAAASSGAKLPRQDASAGGQCNHSFFIGEIHTYAFVVCMCIRNNVDGLLLQCVECLCNSQLETATDLPAYVAWLIWQAQIKDAKGKAAAADGA